MPLLWRYLLSHYLKTFFLCVAAFMAILLTMRLDEIAYFATLGPDVTHILWFTVQQIPYMLPIAFPISALISSMILVQQLSQAHELTAMRACGFSLKNILCPVLIAAVFLSMLNFFIISELATTSHLNSGQLKNQLRSINPLLLLNNKHIMHIKGFHFDTMGPSKVGEYAQDIVFFSASRKNDRLNLLVAKKLSANPETFSGEYVTLITSESDSGNLVIENTAKTTIGIGDFLQMLEKKMWSINNDHLRLPLLLMRIKDQQEALLEAKKNDDIAEIKQAKRSLYCCYTEILKRISVGLAVFSFTLMGLAYGIGISRRSSSRGLLVAIILAAIYLVSFFTAKSFDHALLMAGPLYFVPHLLIWLCSFRKLYRLAHGVD